MSASEQDLLNTCRQFNSIGKFSKTIELLRDDVLESFQNAELYAEKAHSYWRVDKYEFCEDAVAKALIINPKNALASYLKGNIFVKQMDYSKAIECYTDIITVDNKFVRAFNALGNVYLYLKQYPKAIEFYKKAILLDPKFSYPHNGLGNVYGELKEYENAIKSYNIAILLDPNDNFPLNGLANVYADLKEYDKSLDLYKRALKLDSRYADLYFNKALVYQARKEYKKAIRDFNKYIELTKDNFNYLSLLSKHRISEIKKIMDDPDYGVVREIVESIKKLLKYEEPCVTHYTSLTVTTALILENSLFRLSEGTFLNDTSEGRELYDFLPQISVELLKLKDTIATSFAAKPFIGSFVTESKHDDLTLWRMYGKENKEEARGCAITLDRVKLLDNLKSSLVPTFMTSTPEKIDSEFSFFRVAYRNSLKGDIFIVPGISLEDEKKLNEMMSNLKVGVEGYLKKNRLRDKKDILETLNEIAYLFKTSEYQYEYELRLVVKGTGITKKIDTHFCPPRVYVELVSLNPLIKRLTLGPKVERSDEWASAFYYSLDKNGYTPDVFISHLPFK